MTLVLAIDDRQDNLFVLQEVLTTYLDDTTVLVTTDPQAGLAIARERPVDLVLVDLQMPAMDGLEVVAHLRAEEETQYIPVVLITAHRTEAELRAKALDIGADDFLSKPVDNIELVARVRMLLRTKRAEDELRIANTSLTTAVEQRTRDLAESQARLRQAEKMEAMGQLAGGIAHDFNNVLTVIRGNAMVLEKLKLSNTDRGLASDIISAAEHAAELTAQLLAFAGDNARERVSFSVPALIDDVALLLRRSLDDSIALVVDQGAHGEIVAQRGMLQAALLNLVLNARDAMPRGGTVTLRTERIEQQGGGECTCFFAHERVGGAFVEFSVSDQGIGMSPQVLDRVFEPFFTTKGRGQGTGLGLAMVFGFVRDHGGCIDVRSQPGHGSKFFLRLPTEQGKKPPSRPYVPEKPAHVMVVDDQELVLRLARRWIERLGHEVTAFANGKDAFEFYRANAAEIDLVLLDVQMPDMSGPDLAVVLAEENPKPRVVLMSGYPGDIDFDLVPGFVGFVAKPFRPEMLAAVIDVGLRKPRQQN